MRARLVGLWCAAALGLAACSDPSVANDQAGLVAGDPKRGARTIRDFGCGACHTIPGINGANGVVGPPLFFIARRTYIGGHVPNSPANLSAWIRNPKLFEPRTPMPVLGLTEQQADDVTAYLYTLR
jgi:cytochrome c1